MIRWYDYPAAFIFAEMLLVTAFSLPGFGFVVAYFAYEYVWGWYCNFRLEQENDKQR